LKEERHEKGIEVRHKSAGEEGEPQGCGEEGCFDCIAEARREP
jgi:hypothetical protein